MLEWENPVWTLYLRICTQWRYRQILSGYSITGAPIVTSIEAGLDYNPAIVLMQAWGWDIDMGLQMLQVIENERLSAPLG